MANLIERLPEPWIKVPRTVEIIDALQTRFNPSREAYTATTMLAYSKLMMSSEGLYGHILNQSQIKQAGMISMPSHHDYQQVNIPTKLVGDEEVIDHDGIEFIPFIDTKIVSPRAQQLMSLALLALRFTGNQEINNKFNRNPTEPKSTQVPVSEAMERFHKVSGSDQTRLQRNAEENSWRDIINNRTNPHLLLQPFVEWFYPHNLTSTMYTRLGLLRAEHTVTRISMPTYDVDAMLSNFSKDTNAFCNLI